MAESQLPNESLHTLPASWEIDTLGGAAGLGGRKPVEFAGRRPYLPTASIEDGRAKPDRWVTYEERPSRAGRQLATGDVLQAKMIDTNKAFLVTPTEDGWLASTGFAHFETDRGSVDSLFLYYWVSSPAFLQNKDRYCTGTTQQAINKKTLKRLQIPRPPLPEQRRIAQVLDTADAAIRRTEAVIDKLEQAKQGLLHDLLTRGLDDEGRLRPGTGAGTSYGPAAGGPPGWVQTPLQGLCANDVTYGIVQAGPHVEGGVPYVKTGDMTDGPLSIDELSRTSKEIAQDYTRSRVRAGELVITIRATVGVTKEVPTELDGANLTQGTARISPGDAIHNRFLLWALRSAPVQEEISKRVKGTTFREITLGRLRTVPIPHPKDIEEQQRIAENLDRIADQLDAERRTRTKLESVKRGLMQDLLTGRVRVPESIEVPA